MATATIEAETSSIAGPKARQRKRGRAPGAGAAGGSPNVDGAVLSDQDVGQRNG